MKYVTLGIVAHVDAGKTTLSESLMVNTGKLENAGRVDKGDAFLDTDAMEKERGITIFSKQALLDFGDIRVTLLDTPGHVDFSAEAERVFAVLDAAVLVISGADGVQSHTRTLWKLLEAYHIPTFIFVNKMDQPSADKTVLLDKLSANLSEAVADFSDYNLSDEAFLENVASKDEVLIEKFLAGQSIDETDIQKLIYGRELFPVFFGSALKNEGVEQFVNVTARLMKPYDGDVSDSFSGRVFKISRDAKEERLSHIKILSGTLKIRDTVGEDKVNGIRIYDGLKYESVNEAYAGQIVQVTGLNSTYAGAGLGEAAGQVEAVLTPVLSYNLILPRDVDESTAVNQLMKLAEEQPELFLEYDKDSHYIDIRLMGEVQTEILKRRIKERFGYEVSFGEKRIIYKETIDNMVEGIGHFEPLRHYAEVHLLLEPADLGEGMIFECDCSEDILDKNWQRLIMTHLRERSHRGVLIGAPITDIKITVAAGRAHVKHTEGGDFRQATYRAVRQGLMQAKSHLLEPYYDFVLELPTEHVGRAMTDLERLCARDFTPETLGEYTRLTGMAPVSTLADYGREVASYTSGLGQLSLTVRGYGPCHNEEEVLAASTYNPENDIRNTPDSVFCSHGSGVIVPWNEVKAMAHVPSVLEPTRELTDEQIRLRAKKVTEDQVSGFVSVEEVDRIIGSISSNSKPDFIPHKGINRRSTNHKERMSDAVTITAKEYKPPKPKPVLPECLLVDGYNVIYADPSLAALARENLDSARGVLLDMLCDYQGMKGIELIAVFDAYKLQNHNEEFLDFNNIHVVFTKTAQTADYYIERFTKENSKHFRIRVATSDLVEQVIVRGEANTSIVTSQEFLKEMEYTKAEFADKYGVK